MLDDSVQRYNEIARKVMAELKVPVDDLRSGLPEGEALGKLVTGDGVHFTGEGYGRLGTAVGEFVAKHLAAKATLP